MFKGQKDQGPDGKAQMIDKLKKLYNPKAKIADVDNPKYNQLTSHFTRVFKILQAQGSTLGIINDRVNILQNRKNERYEYPIQFRIKQQEKQEYIEASFITKELDQL